jgi:hypothetical protein
MSPPPLSAIARPLAIFTGFMFKHAGVMVSRRNRRRFS